MSKIRVLLIEDSSLMRIVLSQQLRLFDTIELVSTAKNAAEGIEKALNLELDVIVCDCVMPDHDAAYVVEQVMKERPTPIVLLSSLDKNDPLVFDALNKGAIDFVEKPADFENGNSLEFLKNKIHEAALCNLSSVQGKLYRKNTFEHTFTSQLRYDVVLIGASTGGPSALEALIERLPKNFPVPIVIAQHMPARFLETFSQRLNNISAIPVKLAHSGQQLEPNVIYLLPGVNNTVLQLNPLMGRVIFKSSEKKYKEFNNPSVDALFSSGAKVYKEKVLSVILTGMGRDGTCGMEEIKNNNGYTIAQDEESCVVFGMPKSVIQQGVADVVIPLKEIPAFIVNCL